MKTWSLLAIYVVTLALAPGCTKSEQPLPPGPAGNEPGSSTPGSSTRVDASVSPGAQSFLTGTLCALTDLRRPKACQRNAALGNITVTDARGSAQVASNRDGRFFFDREELNTGQGTMVLFADAGTAGYVPSVVSIDSDLLPGGLEVPLVPTALGDDILAVLDIALPDDTGALLVSMRAGDLPIVGGEIIATAAFGVYYDGADPLGWIFGALTGSYGAALVMGVAPPVAEIVAVDEFGNSVMIPNVPVRAGAITFLTVDFGDFGL